MLLAQEIAYVHDVMNTRELDDLLAFSGDGISRLKAFCWDDGFNSVAETIRTVCSMCGAVSDTGMQMLKPKLSASVAIEKKARATDGHFWLKNIHTNKVLAAVGDFEMGLLVRCNGSSTMGEVITALGEEYDTADCIAFLRSLWELRVVCLKK